MGSQGTIYFSILSREEVLAHGTFSLHTWPASIVCELILSCFWQVLGDYQVWKHRIFLVIDYNIGPLK